jgi:hypothetical protein
MPTEKIVHDFENRSHAVRGVMIRGRGRILRRLRMRCTLVLEIPEQLSICRVLR